MGLTRVIVERRHTLKALSIWIVCHCGSLQYYKRHPKRDPRREAVRRWLFLYYYVRTRSKQILICLSVVVVVAVVFVVALVVVHALAWYSYMIQFGIVAGAAWAPDK